MQHEEDAAMQEYQNQLAQEQYAIEREAYNNDLKEILNRVERFVERMHDGLETGWIDPESAYVVTKRCSDILEAARKAITPQTVQKLETEGKITIAGYVLSMRKGAGRYEYTDPEYKKLKEQVKLAEEQRKSAYKMALSGGVFVIEETGEVIPPAVYNEGADTVTMTKAK